MNVLIRSNNPIKLCKLRNLLTFKFSAIMSQFISLTEAIKMTSSYRQNRNDILKSEYQERNILCISETIERSEIEELMHQQGCVKLRIYYGMDDDLLVHAVIVGVDGADKDILPVGEEMILERNARCPDDCPPASPLNS